MQENKFKIILFYKFTPIDDLENFRTAQKILAEKHSLKGRMLIATEGVNATFEGQVDDVENYKQELTKNPKFAELVFKESIGTGQGFSKLHLGIRKEVVTLGAGEFDVAEETAPVITAQELETMYESDEDFVVLDLRNSYEIAVGKFEKTIDPGLANFRDLPGRLQALSDLKTKKVVTVCTGGIRCEKATCLLKREGFQNIYQLKDGIHTYIQQYPGRQFKGSLFVFDNRMVTPVVTVADRTIIGTCTSCAVPCENFYNDDSTRPSTKVICCADCAAGRSDLRAVNPQ